MSFDPHGRVSQAFAAYSPLRHAQHPQDTLCESRIARRVKTAVADCAQSRAGVCMRRVYTSIDWMAVLFCATVVLSVLMGMLLRGVIAGIDGAVCR